ncbi:MAG: hypothetical protein EXS13_08885 [Planctomycetes bacterium]|nr:hypothetical protein [Planctomycetota bacterium]
MTFDTGAAPSPIRRVARSSWILLQLCLLGGVAASLRLESAGLVPTLIACGVGFLVVAHVPASARDGATLAA